MRYPQAIEVDGRRFPINTSYQTAIRCYEIVQDEAVTDAERGAIVMLLLLGDIPQDLSVDGMKRLQELLVKYLQCGQEPEQIRDGRNLDGTRARYGLHVRHGIDNCVIH